MKSAIAAAGAAAILCAGCASVSQGTTQSVRVETQTQRGEPVDGAECSLTNDAGTFASKSGSSALVRRSNKDLEVRCSSPGQPDAAARLVSRANAGLAGNILIGGGIGALIDHGNGSAYTYPTWVRLVFGEFAVFDRSLEREGSVLTATPGAATTVSASTAQAGSATPVSATASAGATGPAPAVAAATAPVVWKPAKGSNLDYELVDRETQRRTTVMLRVDRVDDHQVLFNGGSRIERLDGAIVSTGAPLLGELDAATPPGGWMPGGKVPRGSWPLKFTNGVPGQQMRYDLMARAGGEQVLRLKAGEFRAVRVDLEGWVERTGNVLARARYEGVVWLSPVLQRPVRFEARSRTGGGVGGAIAIDETVELSGISGRD